MTMSPELSAAYAELDAAIDRVRQAIDPELPTFMGDWALVVVEHHLEEPRKNTYTRLFRGGHLPYHVCVGLYETALELTQESGAGDDDE